MQIHAGWGNPQGGLDQLMSLGGIQIELIAPHDDRPSCFRDLFAPGQFGLHHTATFPPDRDEAVRRR